MQHAIQARGLEERVQLLTLSFDPANDGPPIMAEQARRMGVEHGRGSRADIFNADSIHLDGAVSVDYAVLSAPVAVLNVASLVAAGLTAGVSWQPAGIVIQAFLS